MNLVDIYYGFMDIISPLLILSGMISLTISLVVMLLNMLINAFSGKGFTIGLR